MGARGAGVAVLRPGFMAPGAVILPGASTNPDFDIAQLQGLEKVKENAFSVRFDYRINPHWIRYVRVFHDDGSERPEGVSGRVIDDIEQADERRLQPPGHHRRRHDQRVQGGLQRRPTRTVASRQ